MIIPFVCKVLEQGAKSRVFRPPNPWLMAVLKLLVELYHSADLRLNLKFEIEVLCKTLDIELEGKKRKKNGLLVGSESKTENEYI